MSKTNKKFHNRFNDYYEEEYEDTLAKKKVNKSKVKRFDRALKTKDIDTLLDEDFYEGEY